MNYFSTLDHFLFDRLQVLYIITIFFPPIENKSKDHFPIKNKRDDLNSLFDNFRILLR